MSYQIAVLPGDGVGPEVSNAAMQVLTSLAQKYDIELECREYAFGGAAIDACNNPLPDVTLTACQQADAVFLGAVGGPKWDGGAMRPEAGLLDLRQKLGLFANLRPVKLHPTLAEYSPLKAERIKNVDILILRELTGGLYFGEKQRKNNQASDLCTYSKYEIIRIAKVAFEAARNRGRHVTSIDKANVLETSRLWRETVSWLQQSTYPDIELRHELVDSAAMKLITDPQTYDVILTENLFGDILSDECSVLSGSIGLLGSASLGAGKQGLYEPIHGSAPDIAGQNIANPLGAITSIAMLLRHSLNHHKAAMALDDAINRVIKSGVRTRDIGGSASCQEVADKIVHIINK